MKHLIEEVRKQITELLTMLTGRLQDQLGNIVIGTDVFLQNAQVL